MNKPQLLHRIQEVELEMEDSSSRLEAIGARLGDRSPLQEAERTVEGARAKLGDLGKALQKEEQDLTELETKLSSTEKELYGGTVTNPKELEGLRMEAESLRQRRSRREDRILTIMAGQEEAEKELERSELAADTQRSSWEAEQEELRHEQEKLEGRRAALQADLDDLLPQTEPADLTLYRQLRPRKAGRAVALLERGLCAGCRVNVPSRLAQDAKKGTELVTCSSCGRILCPTP